MKQVTAVTGQTLFDIALQEMGSAEGVFDILNSNPFLRLDMAIPGKTIVLVPEIILQQPVVDYYTLNGIKPVSGLGEEVTLNEEDMINITQTIEHELSDGDKSFNGVRLWNLMGNLTVQVDYSNVVVSNVHVYIEQSLDGISYSPVPSQDSALDPAETTITFNITDLLTNFCRVRVEVGDAISGMINEIIWRV